MNPGDLAELQQTYRVLKSQFLPQMNLSWLTGESWPRSSPPSAQHSGLMSPRVPTGHPIQIYGLLNGVMVHDPCTASAPSTQPCCWRMETETSHLHWYCHHFIPEKCGWFLFEKHVEFCCKSSFWAAQQFLIICHLIFSRTEITAFVWNWKLKHFIFFLKYGLLC